MKKILIVFLLLSSVTIVYAESVFLKDGKIEEGKVIKENDRELTLDTADGRKIINRKEIKRILYSDEYKTKMYIGKTDNTVSEGHIVGEDKTRYIIRKKLNSPEETVINKNDVVYVSKKKIGLRKKKPEKPAPKKKPEKKPEEKKISYFGMRAGMLGYMLIQNEGDQPGTGAVIDLYYYSNLQYYELHGYFDKSYFHADACMNGKLFSFFWGGIGMNLGFGLNYNNLLDGSQDNTNVEYIKTFIYFGTAGLTIWIFDWLKLSAGMIFPLYSKIDYQGSDVITQFLPASTYNEMQISSGFSPSAGKQFVSMELFLPWNITVRLAYMTMEPSSDPMRSDFDRDFNGTTGEGIDEIFSEVDMITFAIGYSFK